MTPDVNVLVAAARAGHPHNRVAVDWLRAATTAAAGRPVVLLPVVVAGFLRVVRIDKIAPTLIFAAGALAFIEALLGQPNVGLAPSRDEWPRFADLYRQYEPRGGGVTDIWIAAAVLTLGEHLVTLDRGFRKLLPPDQLTVPAPNAP